MESPNNILELLTSIRNITAHYKIVSILSRIMWLLLELTCYVFAATIILFAFVYLQPEIVVFEKENIKVKVTLEEVMAVVYLIRLVLTLMATAMIIPGLLIRKIRTKNRQIEHVHKIVVGHLKKMKAGG